MKERCLGQSMRRIHFGLALLLVSGPSLQALQGQVRVVPRERPQVWLAALGEAADNLREGWRNVLGAAPASDRGAGGGGGADRQAHISPAGDLRLRAGRLKMPAGADPAALLPVRALAKKAATTQAGALAALAAPSHAFADPAPAPFAQGLTPAARAATLAPEITALAQSLDGSPARIFAYVHDQIAFDPKWGADSPPLGTLWEGVGTSWDQAWLLQELLLAAGVDARLEWGDVEIGPELLVALAGVDDPIRAGDLLATGGYPIVLVVAGNRVISARFPHVWVKAHLDYRPDRGVEHGAADTWIRLDPSLKLFDRLDGARYDQEVPFALSQHLAAGGLASPRADYETALLAWAAGHGGPGSLLEIGARHVVHAESFPFVPGTLRAKIVQVGGEGAEVPADRHVRASLQVRDRDGAVLTHWSGPVAGTYAQSWELTWRGASSADQATLDLYGGVYEAPPFEVNLRPELRLGGALLASGGSIGAAEDAELVLALTPPDGGVVTVALWELFAGEHGALVVDFGSMAPAVAQRHLQAAAAAGHTPAAEGHKLAAAAALYLHRLGADREEIAAWRWQRALNLGLAVFAVQRGAVSTTGDGTPETFDLGPLSLDVGAAPVALMPVLDETLSTVPTLELLGAQGSVREGEALAEVFGGEHVTAVGFLKHAVRDHQQALTRVDAGNLDAALGAAILSNEAEATIRFAVGQGKIAWIAETQLEIGGWQTTGYVIEDPQTGAGAYLVTFERKVTPLEGAIVFHGPVDGDVVTAPTPVTATIGVEGIESWVLATRPAGGIAVPIATGSGAVDNRALGSFDPTLLMNGLHELILTGRNAAGQPITGRIAISVEGGMKVGNLTLALLDDTLPVLGVPLDIVRTYDSRDRSVGDFGHGWRLSLSQFRVQETVAPGAGWRGVRHGGVAPTYCIEPLHGHLVTVTFPDGDVARFQPVVEPSCQPLAPPQVVSIRYRPLGATRARLEPLDMSVENLLVVGSFPGMVELWGQDETDLHDPEVYRLTEADGTELVVDQGAGLRSLEDPNGNVLSVSPHGFEHSSGVSLAFDRDELGRIETITDEAGRALRYEYDANGDLISFEDRLGKTWGFGYQGDHFLDHLIDPEGRRIAAFGYDGENRWNGTCNAEQHCSQLQHDLALGRETVIDATGRRLVYHYDNRGQVTRMVDALGNETSYGYDAQGRLERVEYPDGGMRRMTYDARGNLRTVVDPHPADAPAGEFTTTLTHDTDDRLRRIQFPSGAEYRYTYDAKGNRLRQEDENGNLIVAHTYGPNGVLTSETYPFGHVTLANHDRFGNARQETDHFGRVSTLTFGERGELLTAQRAGLEVAFGYDDLGRRESADYGDGLTLESSYGLDDYPTKMTGPTFGTLERLLTSTGRLRGWKENDGSTTTFEYDAAGRPTAVVGPAQHRVETTYDAAGRRQTQKDGRNGIRRWTYDSVGRVASATDAAGGLQQFRYDIAGRLREVIDPRGKSWKTRYQGRETVLTDPLGRETTLEHSAHGLLEKVTFPDAASTRATWRYSGSVDDADSYPSTRVDAGNRTRSFSYDSHGNLTGVTDLGGAAFTLEVEPETEQVLGITGPTGKETTFTYDSNDRLRTTTYAEGGMMRYDYGGARQLLDRRTLPSLATLDYSYDAARRLQGVTTSDGTSRGFTWNADGTLQSHVDESGTTSYGYDATGVLASIEYPAGAAVTYQRDLVGRIEGLAVRGAAGGPSQASTYTYDPAGNLTAVKDPLGGDTTLAYDDAGRLASKTLPNGITTAFTYDGRDQVASITYRKANGDVLRSVAYQRLPGGEPEKITFEDGAWVDLEYDAGLRLREEVAYAAGGQETRRLAYTYDAAGDRESVTTTVAGVTITKTYGYVGHQVRTVSVSGGADETYSYDADGRVDGIDRGGRQLALDFDDLGQLRTIADGSGTLKSYTWDASGHRVAEGGRRFVVAPGLAGGLDQQWLVADAAGATLAGFAYAGEHPLLRYGPTGTVYYLTDAMGTVIGLADAQGELVAEFDYDAFGNLVAATGPAAAPDPALGGDYRFHGGWWESETGLYQMRARYYDPQLGRFLSRDQAGVAVRMPETQNPYTYALSNPHVFRDPSGLFSISEMNVTMSMGQVVHVMRQAAIQYARDYAKDKVYEAIGQILMDFLVASIPLGNDVISQVLASAEEGGVFETTIRDAMCSTFENVLPAALNYMYFEVSIDENGRPLNDGLFRCGSGATGATKGFPGMDEPSRPDLMFSNIAPTEVAKKHGRSFLVGDIKRSTAPLAHKKGLNQFKAMVEHAENYSYRMVFYLVLRSNPKSQAQIGAMAAEKAALSQAVKVFIITLF